MYRYETHLHTSPVSKCARATVEQSLQFYKSLDYDGVFITNHFIDGNINCDKSLPYAEKIEFYFSDYEEALRLSGEIGLRVFLGVEQSYRGTDFLIYGLDKAWYLAHPELEELEQSEKLALFLAQDALVIQAHPYREASYIDHIRLFPRGVHGIEVFNAKRTELENKMAKIYAENYGLLEFAGSDNHTGAAQTILAGMASETPLADERDFVRRVKCGEMELFTLECGDKHPE